MNVDTKFQVVQFPTLASPVHLSATRGQKQRSDVQQPDAPQDGPEQNEGPRIQAAEETQAGVFSDSEREYFAAMFPAAAREIVTYSPYGRPGMKAPAVVGSLVDLKG